jgi:hypothetical protein
MDMNAAELDSIVPMNGFPINISIINDDPEHPLFTNGKEETYTFRRVIDIQEILGISGITIRTNPARYLIAELGEKSFCINLDHKD